MKMYETPAYLNLNDIAIVHSDFATVKREFIDNRDPKTVVIIGAGPSGLAAGIALRSLGWKVLIIEKRSTFSRSNIIGINKAALSWFQRYDLLTTLLANSSSTDKYPTTENFTQYASILQRDTWLINSDTATTISIKSLQQMLATKFLSQGGMLLSATEVNPSFEKLILRKSADEFHINTADLAFVVVADGAQSMTRAKLLGDLLPSNVDLPTHYFGNVIVSPKPEGLAKNIYFRCGKASKNSAAISVSDHDVSLNFQTRLAINENNNQTVERLIVESEYHMKNLLGSFGLQLPENVKFYPIQNNGSILDGARKVGNTIIAAPTCEAKRKMLNNKFIFVGDAKGISSPRAGIGASLSVAYDATIIDQLAGSFSLTEDNAHLFQRAEQQLNDSINIWAQKTRDKVLGQAQNRNRLFADQSQNAAMLEKTEKMLSLSQ